VRRRDFNVASCTAQKQASNLDLLSTRLALCSAEAGAAPARLVSARHALLDLFLGGERSGSRARTLLNGLACEP
jgi:hypothetical protein